MSTTMAHILPLVAIALVPSICQSQDRDFGQYRVATVGDGLFGLRCQPRQEFYFLQRLQGASDATYLGTCGTPRFITEQMRLQGDPSCFAISESGTSMVYFHRPEICGAGEKAKRKPGGIYVHSAASGDRLLYPQSHVSEMWGGGALVSGAMRVGWLARTPSKEGAQCPQSIVIYADGREMIEGQANPSSPLCRLSAK